MKKKSSMLSKPIMYWLFLLMIFSGFLTSGHATEVYADLILTNGQVVTVDNSVLEKIRARAYKVKKMTAQFPIYRNGAVAIKGKEIAAVGPSSEIVKNWKGPETKILDLKGKVVIPGLTDSHCHSIGLGNDLKRGVDLTMAMSAEEIVRMVKGFIEKNSVGKGEWVLGQMWDQYKYKKMATRWDLDRITKGGQLVELSRVYLGNLYNTEALGRILGIDDDDPSTWPTWWTEDPTPEKVKADPASYSNIPTWEKTDHIYREERFIKSLNKRVKVPSGVFIGRLAPGLVSNHPNYKKYGPQPLPFDEQVIGVKRTCEEYLRWGVTAFRAAEDSLGSSIKIFHEAKLRSYLKIRLLEILHGIYYSPEVHPASFIRKDLSKMYVVRNLDDRYFRWRGTKYYSDGGCGTRSAWLSKPFTNPSKFGEKEPNCGNPVTSDYDGRKETYKASIEQGFDLNTHCCGDQAMRFTVDLYIELMKAIKKGDFPIWKGRKEAECTGWDFRWAIEHAYLPLEPKTHMIEDMSTFNIMAHVQPIFGWQEGIAFKENIGPERMARWTPLRSYFEHGVICPNSSDYPVTTHNPWMSIYFMLTREIQAQEPQSFGTDKDEFPDETVGISEALISTCAMGPYSTFAENWKGSIKKGHVADLVILDLEDIFDLERNPKLLWEMENKILATLVDGEIRYQRNQTH